MTPSRTVGGLTLRNLLFGAAVVAAVACPRLAAAAEPGSAWQRRYDAAKSALIAGRHAEAAAELDRLAAEASTEQDRRFALELAGIARAGIARPVVDPPDIRTSDELSVLYTTAFIYGLGTSAWVVLLTKPDTLAGALLPFAALTTAAVGGVAAADSYRPLRRGVPHSIAAGLYLGFGEGVWLVGLQRAAAERRGDNSEWHSAGVATALWAGSTAGGIVGGLIGASREPTPGRVSFTGSAALWSGLTFGLLGAALEPETERRAEMAFATGGIAYNLGLVGGVVVAPIVAPSVARVRFADLGAIGGGLLGAGLYAVAAERSVNVRAGLAATAAGTATGLGLTWWLTRNMPRDTSAANQSRTTLQPIVAPTEGGWFAGVSGEL